MQTGRVVGGLALNAAEYRAIVRSPDAFEEAVAATTSSARQMGWET